MTTKFVNCCTRNPIMLFMDNKEEVEIPGAESYINLVLEDQSTDTSTGINIYAVKASIEISGKLPEGDCYYIVDYEVLIASKFLNYPLAEKLVALGLPVLEEVPGFPDERTIIGYQSLIR